MAKALLGTHTMGRTALLIDEIRSLRNRVAQLEAELAKAEAARDAQVLALDFEPAEPVNA